MRITVREATEADLPGLLRLLGQLDESMYGGRAEAGEGAPSTRSTGSGQASSGQALLEAFQRILADPNQTILVAEAGGRPVGTAHLMVLQHFDRGLKRSAVVEGVVVDGAYRGKGVGAALMREAAALARRHGCYKLSLTSNVARTGAHRFYSRLGWKRSHYGYSVEV